MLGKDVWFFGRRRAPLQGGQGSTFFVWYLTLWVHFIQYLKEGRHLLFDILHFGCILFNIWRRVDIYLVISSLWVLFPGGSHLLVSLWLFDLGYHQRLNSRTIENLNCPVSLETGHLCMVSSRFISMETRHPYIVPSTITNGFVSMETRHSHAATHRSGA